MTINDKIDKYLRELYEAEDYQMFDSHLYRDEDYMIGVPHVVDRTMREKGLISENRELRMLTSFGVEVSEQGGWLNYLKVQTELAKVKSEEQRELQTLTKQQLELSIREMQVNFTQIKHWWLILIITIVASAVLGALFQALF